MPAKDKIREMFDGIAGDYDKLNHLLSLDVDKYWRRRAILALRPVAGPVEAQGAGMDVLDLACGTGDFAITIAKAFPQAQVTGVDLSEGMLAVMKEKVEKQGLDGRIYMETGDGENLRFPDGTFDDVTIAFGIRNFENRARGLEETLRVLKPGGKLVVLELSRPEAGLLRRIYDFYFLRLLPKIGGSISGDRAAYSYLPASVKSFPGKEEFMKMMSDAGFVGVAHKSLSFGICRMYTGVKA